MKYFQGMGSGAGIEIGATYATSTSALRRCRARSSGCYTRMWGFGLSATLCDALAFWDLCFLLCSACI